MRGCSKETTHRNVIGEKVFMVDKTEKTSRSIWENPEQRGKGADWIWPGIGKGGVGKSHRL